MTNDDRKDRRTASKDDAELEDVRAAWRDLPAEEPPDLLDRAVRNAARRDLERPRRRRLRWIGPFATAGVVVIAVSILLLQDWRPQTGEPAETLRLEERAERGPGTDAAPANRRSTPQMMTARPREKGAADQEKAAATEQEPAAVASDAPAPAAEALQREATPAPEPISAEAWIAELMQLRMQGREAELEAGLEAFRAAYPDYPLPHELGGR
jgi:hypothetical protein